MKDDGSGLLWAGLGVAWAVAFAVALADEAVEAEKRKRESSPKILTHQEVEELEERFHCRGHERPTVYALPRTGRPLDVHPLDKYAYLLDPDYAKKHPRSKISRLVRKIHRHKDTGQGTSLGGMR